MYDEVGGDNVTMIHLELSTRESTSSDENIQINMMNNEKCCMSVAR